MSRSPPSRQRQPAPPADLGALIGDFRALVAHGASDADTAAAAAQICSMLRALSQDEMDVLQEAAQGMPAPAPAGGPAFEDEDADPVGRPR